MRITVPKASDSALGFPELFRAYEQMRDEPEVVLDFNRFTGLHHGIAAFLGGAIFTKRERNHEVDADYETICPSAWSWMQHLGFAPLKDRPNSKIERTVVPFMAFSDAGVVKSHLMERWLGPDHVHLSQRLADAVAEKTWEIYANALEHSQASQVFSCGRYYPRTNKLKLCIVDFGVGIPTLVRGFARDVLGVPDSNLLSAEVCIGWALQSGSTTVEGAARGLGLNVLHDFVRVNGGRMDIYSHDGHVSVRSPRNRTRTIDANFHGTLVNIVFNCDETTYYHYTDEDLGDDTPFF